MKQQSISQMIGLRASPGLARDRLFLGLLVAGVPVSLGMAWLGLAFPPVGDRLLIYLSVLLWYPVVEELAFRGVVQGVASQYFQARAANWVISPANLIATVAFVLWHLLYLWTPLALTLAVPALIYGFFRDRYQSLLPPLILHMSYNVFAILALRFIV